MTSLTTRDTNPKRGDIWLINLDPTVGSEIRKIRPAVVVGSDAIGKLSLKLVAPITDWKDYFSDNVWHVKIEPGSDNGLTKTSAVDTFQLRSVDVRRFVRKLGVLSSSQMLEVVFAIAAVIEFES